MRVTVVADAAARPRRRPTDRRAPARFQQIVIRHRYPQLSGQDNDVHSLESMILWQQPARQGPRIGIEPSIVWTTMRLLWSDR